MSEIILSRDVAAKVLSVVDKGLVSGMGDGEPGNLCVEAAVCYALGLPHSDDPKCVGSAVRAFKIRLNDSRWPTNEDRTKGMRKLAIAQLGSDSIDQMEFANYIALQCQKRILPMMMRNAVKPGHKYAVEIKAAAKLCEESIDLMSAKQATLNAKNVMNNAYAYAEFRLKILNLTAEIGLEALIHLNSPGCALLDLCEEESIGELI